MAEENIYGSNAIVGSKEEAEKILEGRDVDIKASQTQTIQLETTDPIEAEEKPGTETSDQEAPEETPEQTLETEIKNQKQAEEDAKADLEAKGVDFDKLSTEYESTGKLSEESLKALEKAGYPKSVVDAYIAGMEATAQRFQQQVYSFVGGEAEFAKLTQFVQGMGSQYVNAFNKVIETGDLTQINMTLQGFKSQMTAKYGTNNRTIMGRGNNNQATPGFESRAEMVKAMSDPRYQRDPKYTAEVQQKTMRSTFL